MPSNGRITQGVSELPFSQLCPRMWAAFPHFQNQSGIIMIFPYICKELLSKSFALGKLFICYIYFEAVFIELTKCPSCLFIDYLLSSYYPSNHWRHSREKEDNAPDRAAFAFFKTVFLFCNNFRRVVKAVQGV